MSTCKGKQNKKRSLLAFYEIFAIVPFARDLWLPPGAIHSAAPPSKQAPNPVHRYYFPRGGLVQAYPIKSSYYMFFPAAWDAADAFCTWWHSKEKHFPWSIFLMAAGHKIMNNWRI